LPRPGGDYQRFLIRYDMPPPSQQNLVQDARAALTRLSGAADSIEGRP
jgi:hypothetical protein